jgi:PAS domain S-box-containing protein
MATKNMVKKLFLYKWSLIIAVIGLLTTTLLSMQVNSDNNSRVRYAAEEFKTALNKEIVGRFELYQYGLRSVRGIFATFEEFGVTRASFQKYSATRDIGKEFPGALGFGFIRRLDTNEVPAFVNSARSDGWPTFDIRELSPNKKERYVIQYIEPIERNKQAVGLDIASEDNRRKAAQQAIQSGEIRLTGPITLVQATGQPLQSFLILMPMYEGADMPVTEEARNKLGFGWSYAPLITSEVLSDLQINSNFYQIELTDVTDAENPEIFYTNNTESEDLVLSITNDIRVYGRTWSVKVGALPALVSQLNQVNLFVVSLLGFMLTLLTSGLVRAYESTRSNRLAIIAEQAKLASIVSSSNDAIIGLTLDGRFISWNGGAQEIFGFSDTEVLGESYAELLVPEELKKQWYKLLNNAIKGQSISSTETLHKHKQKDKPQIPISISLSPIYREHKEVSAVSIIVRDISFQKKSEQEIRDLNNNLEAQVKERIAEALHIRDQLILASNAAELGVWVWNCVTNELSWNDKMFEIYRYPITLRNEGIEYAHWLNRIHPKDRAGAQNSLQKALDDEEKWDSRFRLVWPDGQTRHVKAQALVKFDSDGTPLSVTGVNRDITDEVEREKSLQLATQKAVDANASKSLFLSNMSHEIRTPMNGIYGTLQLLKNEALSDRSRNFISKAEYSCKNMIAIINDILDFSKIEAGKIDFENVEFSLTTVVDSITSDMQPLAQAKSIQFISNNSITHDEWIGDPIRVGQVILNLVSNAVKFTNEGKVTLTLFLTQKNDIAIEVCDTGIGMDKTFIDKVFSRFSQADVTITRKYGGTGLGMSITQSLVDLMGGNLTIESVVDKGTTVKVFLPLKQAKINRREAKCTTLVDKSLDLTGKSILIAEDNAINQELIEAILEPFNASLAIVNNGEEAVKSAISNPPDLILMDIQMPIKDGVTACKEILTHFDHMPIVALTANVMPADIDRYMKAGFSAHIGKPVEIDLLKQTLDELIFGQ